ncbi:hypothetical protein LR013_03520 [candidate division NPL-UPA2 bacterium]|nr:hypothetical protein [candidate division NPL-UPA2 bacterium]
MKDYNNNKEKYFENFIPIIVYGLNDLGFKNIYQYFHEVSSDEVEWASRHLHYNYEKLKNEGHEDIWIYRYLITKTIAILSLWSGYISEDGKFQPPMEIAPPIVINAHTSRWGKTSPKSIAIIPTRLNYNRPEISNLENNLLNSLVKSEYLQKIIFVGNIDSKSQDFLLSIPKTEFIEIAEKKDSPAYSRNVGIGESLSLNSDVTMFIDDDVRIQDPTIVDKLILKAYNTRGVVSPLVESTGSSWLDTFHNYDGTLNGVYYRNDQLLYATTCCMVLSYDILLSGIRFDNNFKIAAGEDIDFSIQALYMGFPIIAEDNIRVFHEYRYPPDNGLDRFIQRYFRYGIGNFSLFKKHPYYYSLLSNCRERPTWSRFTKRKITVIPKEIEYLTSKIEGV